MKLDTITNQVYIVAFNEAKLKTHRFVTPEHFLYAAVMFELGKDIVEASGGEIERINHDIQKYFDEKVDSGIKEPPLDSVLLIKMFEQAAVYAASAEKQEVTLGDLFVSMIKLEDSFAPYILQKNGVDSHALIKYVAHELKGKNEGSSGKKPDEMASCASNLIERAKAGEFDPLVGRQAELSRITQVLLRRQKNNPVLVGDPGVGKTAIVNGLALLIANGEHESLKNANVYQLSLSAVVAGTKYRGDFEEKFLKVLEKLKKEPNTIVFIDEIHNAVGAGSVSANSMDAASIIKPYLTDGTLRFIGCTSFEEYKKYFEKDSSLTRRFQKIDIEQATVSESVEILKGLRPKYESFHQVSYPDEVIEAICRLSGKYFHERKMPDIAVDVMDETGAAIRLLESKERDAKVVTVSVPQIEKTIASMTKIPETKVSENEILLLRHLEPNINKSIFGQDAAVKTVTEAINASRCGLNNEEKPVASLLFVGPTGVGKTELAKVLAKELNIELIRFDMSEYQEAHAVSRLVGSPPGYVGYDAGGLLTESIRKTPNCVLLLDEVEKSHPDIMNVLLQVMDYGKLTDNTGKKADFRNVVLIMTSNAGARDADRRVIGFEETKLGTGAIEKEVERVFSPEFRNRLDEIVLFNSMNEDMAENISRKAIATLSERLSSKGFALVPSEAAVKAIAKKGLTKKFGAREIIRIVEKDFKKQLVEKLIFSDNIEDSNNHNYLEIFGERIKIIKHE